jgi:hypothetical protein
LIYDIGGKIIAEYGGLQSTDVGGVKYVLSDWQGSTRAIVNQGGFVQARIELLPFFHKWAGKMMSENISFLTPRFESR